MVPGFTQRECLLAELRRQDLLAEVGRYRLLAQREPPAPRRAVRFRMPRLLRLPPRPGLKTG